MSAGEGATLPIGPVQMLVIGFDEPKFKGEILPELKRLNEAGVVRVLDLLVVQKNDSGDVETHQISDLAVDEAMEVGALIGALVGVGMGEDDVEPAAVAGAAEGADGHLLDEQSVWYLADAIPEGTAAAIALLEHRWAIPLRDKIVEAGGMALADEWIHPADLIAAGVAAKEAGVSAS